MSTLAQFSTIRMVLTALAFTFLHSGCGGGSNAGTSTPAMLRVINGIWGNPVNLTIDGASMGEVPYTSCVSEPCTVLSSYTTVKSGSLDIAIMEQGGTTNVLPTRFQKLNLAPNTNNTLVVFPTDGGGMNATLVLDDDVPAANQIKVKLVDVSENVLTASAWFVPTGTTPSGNPTIGPVPLGSASSDTMLQPNTYDIYVPRFNCGFDSNCNLDTVAMSANQNFSIYLLWEGFASRTLILVDN